jgi:hypothetical protein
VGKVMGWGAGGGSSCCDPRKPSRRPPLSLSSPAFRPNTLRTDTRSTRDSTCPS